MANKIKINKTKQTLINQNIAQSKFGMYAQCATGNCIKNHFTQNFNIGEVNNICEVDIVNMHAIDAIKEYCQLGFNAGFKDGWINPVSMCTVGDDFIGSNYPQSEGIRDDTYNIRTNYNTITKNNNPFPLKQNECVYNRFVTVIRDSNLQAITDLQNLYRFGLITVAPINKPKLLDENRMHSTDFIKIMCIVETIFQTAIAGSHNILVLTPFGNTEDDVPQEDIVKIFNSCIFKYGHRFKKIVVAVPIWYGTYMFDLFNNEIIRPQLFEEEQEPETKIKKKKSKEVTSSSNNKTKSENL
jgi:hypothetical protein